MAAALQFKSTQIDGVTFEVPSRYTLKKLIGSGAYGQVASGQVVYGQNEEACAIKKVSNIFGESTDTKRCLREVIILSQFDHENIIRLWDMWPNSPNINQELQDVYLVTNLMETDLSRIVRSNQVLGSPHIHYFIYQILRGLKYIHSANIVHRDLKPSNLLVNRNCDLKICDFGLSRTVDESDVKVMKTEYVVTRWYRAPEIMLSSHHYSTPVDLWAVGCIMAELFLKQPLFPGHDYIDQCKRIFGVLGTPTKQGASFITNKKAKDFVFSLPQKSAVDFSHKFPEMPEEGRALLRKLLEINPQRRISTIDALKHSYLHDIHEENDEPTCTHKFNFAYETEFSRSGCNRTQKYREAVLKQIAKYRPEFNKPYEELYACKLDGKDEDEVDEEWQFGDAEEEVNVDVAQYIPSMSIHGNDSGNGGPKLDDEIKKK